MITFRFENLRVDRRSLATRWDLLLGIVAEFSVLVDERHFYYEEEFPVVELASQLGEWLRRTVDEGSPSEFIYESMESEEPNLISFQRSGLGWCIRSPFQRYAESKAFEYGELVAVSTEFVRSLREAVKSQLGIDIEPALTPCGK